MSLVTLDLPAPASLRGGWAAFAAVCAAMGSSRDVLATATDWLYHDGGGNWAAIRFFAPGRAILFGHDHEYSDTYFREAAAYFGEEETDLLAGAPDWWGQDLSPPAPMGEWVSFVYGWDGELWRRASYELSDGFGSVGLLRACSVTETEQLARLAESAPGLGGRSPDPAAIAALVAADADVSEPQVEAVVPGWDAAAGAAAARAFLLAPATSTRPPPGA